MENIYIDDIKVEVEWKNIKNLHLTIYPPDGRVHVSAPRRLSRDSVRLYLVTKLPWMRSKLENILSVERQGKRHYISGEDHYFFGQRYRLKLQYADAAPTVYIENNSFMVLRVRPDSTEEQREEVMYAWYRSQLRTLLDKMIPAWEERMGVKSSGYRLQRMKTEWGSCNHRTHFMHFNSELAKKPLRCIELIVIHELNHITHRLHDTAFKAAMTRYLPGWEARKKELNTFIV